MTFEHFLQEYSQYISFAVFALIAIVVIIYVLLPLLRRNKKPKIEVKRVELNEFYEALGGETNVIAFELNGSRLSVELLDMKNFDKEKLKSLGVVRIIEMKTRLMLLVDESFKHLKK